mgnify:CR=1 FL=1
MYAHPGTSYPTTTRVKHLAENPRTATKAGIKRASKSARGKMRQLDKEQISQLERAYRQAVEDIGAYLKGRAGDDNTLRLEVMRDLMDQANARLAALAGERDDLLNIGLFNAADLGAQPFAETGLSLMKVADDAVRKVTQFVADDGLQLSTRIWNLNHQADEIITQSIQRAIIQGHSASQAAQEFLARGANIPADLAKNINASQWDKIYAQIKNGLLTGDGSAYSNAKRVFRTEINRAHGEAYQGAAFEHPDVIGTRFLLSPNHPKTDICDMHARVNRYGLGPGVYPKDKNPWPAHPNTLSFTEVVFADEVSDEDRAGKEDRIEWLKKQPAGVQESVLASRKKRAALERGLITENQIGTPWNVLKKRFERKGIDVEKL